MMESLIETLTLLAMGAMQRTESDIDWYRAPKRK